MAINKFRGLHAKKIFGPRSLFWYPFCPTNKANPSCCQRVFWKVDFKEIHGDFRWWDGPCSDDKPTPVDRFHFEVSISGPDSSQSSTSYRNVLEIPAIAEKARFTSTQYFVNFGSRGIWIFIRCGLISRFSRWFQVRTLGGGREGRPAALPPCTPSLPPLSYEGLRPSSSAILSEIA